MSEHIHPVNDGNFEEVVLQSSTPVLVDFWATWCGPCKAIAPLLEKIAVNPIYTNKIKIVKLDVDNNPMTPQRYGIRGIPTLILFKNGQVEATKVGAVPESQLTNFIDENI